MFSKQTVINRAKFALKLITIEKYAFKLRIIYNKYIHKIYTKKVLNTAFKCNKIITVNKIS